MDNDAYARYVGGDDSALSELINEYRGGLTLYINSFVNDLGTADELCAEAFAKIAVKKPKFRGDSSFKTYLYAVGRNIALDHLKKARSRPTVPISDALQIPDELNVERYVLRQEKKRVLYRAISSLKAEHAQVLYLTYFEGMSDKETAAVIKKSLSATEGLKHRAKAALKAVLEKEGFEYDEW